MLTKIDASSENLDTLQFLLQGFNPASSPFEVRNVDGIGPEKADITSAPLATRRGAFFQGRSTGIRNIVLTIGLNPNWADQTMASLRHQLYKYFMPEKWIKLNFYSDDIENVGIEGIVESCDPNIFAEDPEMQISIICHQPDFVEDEATTVQGIVPNSLIDGMPEEYTIDYVGTAPTGFELQIWGSIDEPAYTGRIIVVNQAPVVHEVFDLDPVDVAIDKYLKLSTVPTNRIVETVTVDDDVHDDMLKSVVTGSKWLELYPGDNTFSVGAEESGLTWVMTYYNRYGGL